MLKIVVPGITLFNDETNDFIETKDHTLQLEHSLLSISKWEMKYHKPFMSKEPKTDDETMFYIKCMTITSNVDDNVYVCLTNDNRKHIIDYIDNDMTATIITKNEMSTVNGNRRKDIITNELIYAWMIDLHIPFECERWHLKRLLTLIEVCNIRNNPGKKMSKKEILQHNRALNEARKQQYNTTG
jgi:hypothetical protein